MATTSIVCTACGAAVPYGRLSCPDCGELLASVGSARRARSASSGGGKAAARKEPDVLMRVGPAETTIGSPTSAVPAPPEMADIDTSHGETAAYDGPASVARLTQSFSAASGPASSSTPGAYVPPQAVAAAPRPSPSPLLSNAVPAPARAWESTDGYGEAVQPGEPLMTSDASTAPGAAGGAKSSNAGVEPDKLAEFTGWLSVAGAALAAVGFILPWSSSVIGATGVGYFDRWGLAGPGNAVVVIGLLVVLGLGLVQNPIPAWIRVGIPGIALGALLVGLAWPYLLGPLGAQAGLIAVAAGAAALLVAGVLAIATDRHVGDRRSV